MKKGRSVRKRKRDENIGDQGTVEDGEIEEYGHMGGKRSRTLEIRIERLVVKNYERRFVETRREQSDRQVGVRGVGMKREQSETRETGTSREQSERQGAEARIDLSARRGVERRREQSGRRDVETRREESERRNVETWREESDRPGFAGEKSAGRRGLEMRKGRSERKRKRDENMAGQGAVEGGEIEEYGHMGLKRSRKLEIRIERLEISDGHEWGKHYNKTPEEPAIVEFLFSESAGELGAEATQAETGSKVGKRAKLIGKLARVKKANKQPQFECPVEGCRGKNTQMRRHLRAVHNFTEEDFNKLYPRKENKRDRARPRRRCPVPGCNTNSCRLDQHLVAKHGITAYTGRYYELLHSARLAGCPDENQTNKFLEAYKDFLKSWDRESNATTTKLHLNGVTVTPKAKLGRVRTANKRPQHNCPIEGCRGKNTQMRRHLRAVHDFSEEDINELCPKKMIHTSTDRRRRRLCPVSGCSTISCRIDRHLVVKHGVASQTEKYYNLLHSSSLEDPSDEKPGSRLLDAYTDFLRRRDSGSKKINTKCHVNGIRVFLGPIRKPDGTYEIDKLSDLLLIDEEGGLIDTLLGTIYRYKHDRLLGYLSSFSRFLHWLKTAWGDQDLDQTTVDKLMKKVTVWKRTLKVPQVKTRGQTRPGGSGKRRARASHC